MLRPSGNKRRSKMTEGVPKPIRVVTKARKREVTPERKTNWILLFVLVHGKHSNRAGYGVKVDTWLWYRPTITYPSPSSHRDKHAPYINASHTTSIIIVSSGAGAWELRPCVCFPPPLNTYVGKTVGICNFAIRFFVSKHCFRKLWTILTKRIRWNQNSSMHLASYLGAFFGNYVGWTVNWDHHM